MNHPDDLRYTKTHEWVRIDGDTATIGITIFPVQSPPMITTSLSL